MLEGRSRQEFDMTEITRVSRGELRSDEVVETVEDGGRVIIEVGMLGRTLEMAVRKYDDTYYCDTPVKLLTYDDEEGLKRCLERYRLASRSKDENGGGEGSTAERAAGDSPGTE